MQGILTRKLSESKIILFSMTVFLCLNSTNKAVQFNVTKFFLLKLKTIRWKRIQFSINIVLISLPNILN